MTIWWWQKALDQPALIQILLATSAMHAASLSLTSYQPPQLTRSAAWHCLRFRQETLQSLQKILSHSTKRALEAALLVIINLICTEVSTLCHVESCLRYFL